MPNSAFFNLFHKQKKFSETGFTKLLANPYPLRISKDFTNHFSVICQQRVKWHLEHQKYCACRPVPEKLATEMKKREIKF
jgi:hypothetical protein